MAVSYEVCIKNESINGLASVKSCIGNLAGS